MAHPIPHDIPLHRFRVKDDLAAIMKRLTNSQSLERVKAGGLRFQRFELNPECRQHTGPLRCNPDVGPFREQRSTYSYVDSLMEGVPGKDNYVANLTDDFDESLEYGKDNLLNVGFYSRYYDSGQRGDAMGRDRRRRTFNDPNVWAAMTTNSRVSGVSVEADRVGNGCGGCNDRFEQKWSWAFPLEIIYMTPLTAWNPYGIVDKSRPLSLRDTVDADGRNGGFTAESAFDGMHSHGKFYQTPAEFFEGGSPEEDPADTNLGVVGVLDQNGTVQRVVSSGHHIIMPRVSGLDVDIRQRYPIAPIHEEGNAVWKEVKALADIVGDDLGDELLGAHFHDPVGSADDDNGDTNQWAPTTLLLTTGTVGHTHELLLSVSDVELVQTGHRVTLFSERRNGHMHEVIVAFRDGVYTVLSMNPYEDHGLLNGQVDISFTSTVGATTTARHETPTDTVGASRPRPGLSATGTRPAMATAVPLTTPAQRHSQTHGISWGGNALNVSLVVTVGDTVVWHWDQEK